MSIISFYVLVLAVIALLLWQLPKLRKLSSYNIKWVILYIIYVLWVVLADIRFFGFEKKPSIEDAVISTLLLLLLLPFIVYLLFPTLLRMIEKWEIVKFIDKVIDTIYQNIKRMC